MATSAPAPAHSPALPLRCVSIDVEDYYHIEAAYKHIPRTTWPNWPSRVEQNVDKLLGLFDAHQIKGTFFMLGDVAQHHRSLAGRIAGLGHEIACHGMHHDKLSRLNAASFKQDVQACQKLLEDQIGQRVLGYRAPSFSIVKDTAWAIDVLVELGFVYDASIFPVKHPAYGVPGAPLEPFNVKSQASSQAMLELPPLVWRVGHKNIPVAGGGYFRLLPLELMLRGLKQAARESRPAILYFHPWEFDGDMPLMPLPFFQRVRTYTGLSRSETKLNRIMALPGQWMKMGEIAALQRTKTTGLQEVVLG